MNEEETKVLDYLKGAEANAKRHAKSANKGDYYRGYAAALTAVRTNIEGYFNFLEVPHEL